MAMPPPPAAPIDPYTVFVTSVTYNGSPVSGASITLYNTTKGTSVTKVSGESNSNVAIMLAECGDWGINDVIHAKAVYSGNEQDSGNHTVVSGDNGKHDFETIAIVSSGGTPTGLRITSTHTPSSSSDTGTQGQIATDDNYLYRCYATNSWKRIAWNAF